MAVNKVPAYIYYMLRASFVVNFKGNWKIQ